MWTWERAGASASLYFQTRHTEPTEQGSAPFHVEKKLLLVVQLSNSTAIGGAFVLSQANLLMSMSHSVCIVSAWLFQPFGCEHFKCSQPSDDDAK